VDNWKKKRLPNGRKSPEKKKDPHLRKGEKPAFLRFNPAAKKLGRKKSSGEGGGDGKKARKRGLTRGFASAGWSGGGGYIESPGTCGLGTQGYRTVSWEGSEKSGGL